MSLELGLSSLSFLCFVVQQIQQAPMPKAGFSYGSLARGIWKTFLLGDKAVRVLCLPATGDGFVA